MSQLNESVWIGTVPANDADDVLECLRGSCVGTFAIGAPYRQFNQHNCRVYMLNEFGRDSEETITARAYVAGYVQSIYRNVRNDAYANDWEGCS